MVQQSLRRLAPPYRQKIVEVGPSIFDLERQAFRLPCPVGEDADPTKTNCPHLPPPLNGGEDS